MRRTHESGSEESPQLDMTERWRLIHGCALHHLPKLPGSFVNATITSPPYFRQKDYSVDGQIGWESCLDGYLAKIRTVFAELYRITDDAGACFFVIGDSFSKKCLQLVPHRAAILACECGWILRNDLIWSKRDAVPGAGADRWRVTHEHILFLTKRARGYKFHADAIRIAYSKRTVERWGSGQQYGGPKSRVLPGPMSNRFSRGKSFALNPAGTLPPDVLVAPASQSHLNHFATFPVTLIEQFVRATTDPGELVFDPFAGTASTGDAALSSGRRFLGIELSPAYMEVATLRLARCAKSGSERLKEESARGDGMHTRVYVQTKD